MSDRIPRLDFGDLEPTLAAALEPRMKRLGYLGEFFRCAAHKPAALLAFHEFTVNAKQGLDDRVVETIALTMSVWVKNDYERNQHERLSVRLGFGRDWVEEVEKLSPDDANLSNVEKAVQRYCLKAAENKGKNAAREFEQVIDELGPEGAVAVLMVMGRYLVHGLIVNTLDLAPPVPSIFEDGFQG